MESFARVESPSASPPSVSDDERRQCVSPHVAGETHRQGGSVAVGRRAPPSFLQHRRQSSFSEDGTYLISGGLGGFGLATANWIAERGGRHLVLMGRRGVATEEARARVEALRQKGIEVKVATADVSDESQVAATIADIDATMPPLRGVFHSALVLRDVLLMNLAEEQMRDVWEPKVLGALNLHRQTLGRPIDVFVLYSSLSAVFGMGGQGNYASANSFLDGLASHRKANGLAGNLGQLGFPGRDGLRGPEQGRLSSLRSHGHSELQPCAGSRSPRAVPWRGEDARRGHAGGLAPLRRPRRGPRAFPHDSRAWCR